MRKNRALTLGFLALTILSGSALAGEDKYNSSLRFLRSLREKPVVASKATSKVLSVIQAERAVVTVKFDHVLSAAEIDGYEQWGLSFHYVDGQVARTAAIYPVEIPWALIDEVSGRKEILRMESAWKPAVYPTLNVSGPEIEADSAWSCDDPLGYPITGKGKRLADFDTGIDVYHPSFFYADGDTFDWIDVDGNIFFTNGVDAVDLNRNGVADPGEKMRFLDGWIYDPAGTFGLGGKSSFQTYFDWLYADLNNNGGRDFGPAAGFTESDPTYGEPLFIGLDDNNSGKLESWEPVCALGTSKIYGTMNAGSVERIRGVDLMLSDDDTNGHGTAVSGILAGGTAWHHAFPGIAPDAEILAGYFFSGVPVSYLVPWARSRDADAMLYEFGGFIYDFLDGSSLDEEIISIEHPSIIQITPSGNLGRGNKHAVARVLEQDSITLQITIPYYDGNLLAFYGTTLWRAELSDLTFRLRSPAGNEITLQQGEALVDFYYTWCDFDTSSRGTAKLDLWVDRNMNPHAMGTWELKVVNNSPYYTEIISNVADDNSSWAGGAEFLNYVSDDKNVTWPATSDRSFVNGSYSTRGYEGYGGVGGGTIPVGEISKFSGRGRRIDGKSLLDICSPGNYDVYTTLSHSSFAGYPLGSYRQFSGTSAAGPHVAAAAALVQQAFPDMTMGQVEYLLCSAAATDQFTGPVYNETWGYGKLRIRNAIGVAVAVEEMAGGERAPELFLDQNYPNPFNPATWIPFFLPADGQTSIRIYDVKGRLIKTVRERWYRGGPHSVIWNGSDDSGRRVASGVYFCVLQQGDKEHTRKLVLIR